MKNTFLLTMLTGLVLTLASSCDKKCDDWFEKDDKDCIEMREKFFGTYVGTYSEAGQTTNGSVTLVTHSDGEQKIALAGTSNYFVLSASTSFDIPLQNVYDPQATYTMEGSGSLSGNQLTFNVTRSLNGQSFVLNFTGTK